MIIFQCLLPIISNTKYAYDTSVSWYATKYPRMIVPDIDTLLIYETLRHKLRAIYSSKYFNYMAGHNVGIDPVPTEYAVMKQINVLFLWASINQAIIHRPLSGLQHCNKEPISSTISNVLFLHIDLHYLPLRL